jgi:uncharacterized protein (TIGR03083 family)
MTPRELSRAEVVELLAAVALHATSDEEAVQVEELVAGDPELSAELDRLRRAASRLASLEERSPDPRLRDSVLATARSRRAPATPTSLYREVVADVGALIGTLAGADWEQPTVHDWALLDLVAHLAASEELIADLLEGHRDAVTIDDLLTATAEARARGDAPEVVVAEYRSAAERVLAHPDTQPDAPRRRVAYGYTEVSVATMLVTRALEVHVHACDIRWALDRPLVFPSPGSYRLMTELGIRVWPLALALGGRSHSGKAARLVLEGVGGGEWTIPLHPGETPGEPDVTIIADVVDFCFLAADRRRPDEIAVVVDPPEARALVDDLLAVASTFANE